MNQDLDQDLDQDRHQQHQAYSYPLTITERDLSSLSYTSTTRHYHPSQPISQFSSTLSLPSNRNNKTMKNFSYTTSSFSYNSHYSSNSGSGSRANQHVCNNCGKIGHLCYQCKLPIISYGIILFRQKVDQHHSTAEPLEPEYEYLMICRRNTFGYIDFVRGKYSVHNILYLRRLFSEMTKQEKQNIISMPYEQIWADMWETPAPISAQSQPLITSALQQETKETTTTPVPVSFRMEESNAKHKFEQLRTGVCDENGCLVTLETLCKSGEEWLDPEWEFPKGRRNYSEKELTCALREFQEETGYSASKISVIENLMPFEEQFIGSNWKAYKHKYFLAYVQPDVECAQKHYQTSEVSKMEWKTYEECMKSIRSYHLEKRTMITNIHKMCTSGMFYSVSM